MNFRSSILLFVAAVIGLASCKNNDEVFKKAVSTDLTVVNASADTLNFYLNGTRQNNASSLYPNGSLTHLTEPAGMQNYGFKKAGNPNILFNVPLNLTDSVYNSLYIAGETVDKTFHTVDTLLIDTLPYITAVRFVNASPDAGNLNIHIGDTVRFNTRPFKSSSIFKLTGSGQKEVRIYLTGIAAPKIDTIITFQANKVYTLFSKGLLNGKGSAVFNVGVVQNY